MPYYPVGWSEGGRNRQPGILLEKYKWDPPSWRTLGIIIFGPVIPLLGDYTTGKFIKVEEITCTAMPTESLSETMGKQLNIYQKETG